MNKLCCHVKWGLGEGLREEGRLARRGEKGWGGWGAGDHGPAVIAARRRSEGDGPAAAVQRHRIPCDSARMRDPPSSRPGVSRSPAGGRRLQTGTAFRFGVNAHSQSPRAVGAGDPLQLCGFCQRRGSGIRRVLGRFGFVRCVAAARKARRPRRSAQTWLQRRFGQRRRFG